MEIFLQYVRYPLWLTSKKNVENESQFVLEKLPGCFWQDPHQTLELPQIKTEETVAARTQQIEQFVHLPEQMSV